MPLVASHIIPPPAPGPRPSAISYIRDSDSGYFGTFEYDAPSGRRGSHRLAPYQTRPFTFTTSLRPPERSYYSKRSTGPSGPSPSPVTEPVTGLSPDPDHCSCHVRDVRAPRPRPESIGVRAGSTVQAVRSRDRDPRPPGTEAGRLPVRTCIQYVTYMYS